VAPVDLAYAIESYVHGPDPDRFFDQCRRLIRPGGLLVVCDDVRRNATSPAAARAIDQFVRGWHVNTLLTREETLALALANGFDHRSTMDLTPFLEIHRVRDEVIGAILALLGWARMDLRRFDYAVGGRALQRCLARGWVGYELSVFTRLA
jgi:SAM-dependent methyltransferase